MNNLATQPLTKTMQCIVAGLSKLVEGQKQFAEEFGLNFSRIFPNLEEGIQEDSLKHQIEQWLTGEVAEGEEKLQQLFTALVKHQLALTAALDGIALQTIQELMPKSKRLKLPIKNLLLKNSDTTLQELKINQRLRYQKLIVPGFVDTYIKVREKLR